MRFHGSLVRFLSEKFLPPVCTTKSIRNGSLQQYSRMFFFRKFQSFWLFFFQRCLSSQCSNLREHSVCTNSVSNFRCSSVDVRIPVSPVVTGTVHPTRSADSQEFCRSVMENSEPSASRSDLGLGIIDTACFFCVAGSDWWANYKSLLEDFGLKHEIDETREAERYKFGDGGTLVSSIRVTAPIFVAGKKGGIVFSVVPSTALVDWSRFPDDLVVSRAAHLALRLNPQD